MAELDRTVAAQKNAQGLTSDLRSVYGLRSMSLFSRPGVPVSRPKTTTIRPAPPGKSMNPANNTDRRIQDRR